MTVQTRAQSAAPALIWNKPRLRFIEGAAEEGQGQQAPAGEPAAPGTPEGQQAESPKPQAAPQQQVQQPAPATTGIEAWEAEYRTLSPESLARIAAEQKQHAKTWEGRAADNYASLHEANGKIAALEAQIAAAAFEAEKAQIAAETGVPLEVIKTLQGSTKEELTAAATAIKNFVTPQAPQPAGDKNQINALQQALQSRMRPTQAQGSQPGEAQAGPTAGMDRKQLKAFLASKHQQTF